jgi:hypothetical protein
LKIIENCELKIENEIFHRIFFTGLTGFSGFTIMRRKTINDERKTINDEL